MVPAGPPFPAVTRRGEAIAVMGPMTELAEARRFRISLSLVQPPATQPEAGMVEGVGGE